MCAVGKAIMDLFEGPEPPKPARPVPPAPNPELTARTAQESQEVSQRRRTGARRGTSSFRSRLSINLPQ